MMRNRLQRQKIARAGFCAGSAADTLVRIHLRKSKFVDRQRAKLTFGHTIPKAQTAKAASLGAAGKAAGRFAGLQSGVFRARRALRSVALAMHHSQDVYKRQIYLATAIGVTAVTLWPMPVKTV